VLGLTEIEYPWGPLADAEPKLPPASWRDRLAMGLLVLGTLVFCWLMIRGFYLAGKELVHWL
jgi:hypothetical protein